MPYPSETYLNMLRSIGTYVPNEFESLYAQLEGYLTIEHKDDGSHSAITADSLTLAADGALTLEDGSTLSVVEDVPTVTGDFNVTGDLDVAGALSSVGATNSGSQTYSGSGNYALSGPGGVTITLNDDHVVRITSVSTSPSLAGLIAPWEGRSVRVINTTSTAFSILHDSSGTFAVAQILCPKGLDWVMEPGSAVFLWYDTTSSRWRLVSEARGDGSWTDYTVAWTATSGTAPALGNATVVSRYAVVGKTCHFQIHITFGSTSTYGSGGAWLFSLPTPTSVTQCNATASALLSSVRKMATAVRRDSNQDLAVFWNQDDSAFTNTNPGSWASGDTLVINGTYEVS